MNRQIRISDLSTVSTLTQMKNIFLLLFIFICFFIVSTAGAQVSINININHPPAWAPQAYARTVRYYYIPEMDSYYDASRRGYYFNEGEGWYFSPTIPDYYGNIDLFRAHHVIVNYYGSQPYSYFNRQRYAYVQSYHENWRDNGWYRPHDNGRHNGWYKHHWDNNRDNRRDENQDNRRDDNQGNRRNDHYDNGNNNQDHGDDNWKNKDKDHGDDNWKHKDKDHGDHGH